MGLDYSYVLLLKKSQEPLLRAHLTQVGALEELRAPFGTCVTLDFALDEQVTTYLKAVIRDRDGASWKRGWFFKKQDYRTYFPTETTGRVGCIYFDLIAQPAGEYCYACFTAATSKMSRLFQHSTSIKGWFLHLSSVLKAEAAFLDLEAEGYVFIYRQGREMTVELTEELHIKRAAAIDTQAVVEICSEYAELASFR